VFPKIHAVILKIPKGKVATYGQVAAAAGFPGAARQVVWALRSVRGLPWHRVLGAGGKIRLPGESGFEQKMRLQNEGITFVGERVRMDLHQFEFATRRTKRKKKRNGGGGGS
jgi:methylated-DNA-protein-cysteine methyltransferase related protein